MSNEVKQSLESNQDEILSNLPEEFHGDFKASIESAAPAEKLSPKQAKDAAAALMRDNPDIDDAACVPLLDSDSTIGCAIEQPSTEELEAQKKEALAQIAKELDS